MSDPEVSLDTILKFGEIISIVGGGAIVAFKLGAVTQRVEQTLVDQNAILTEQKKEIVDLKTEMKKLADVLTQIAVQENRLDRIEDDVRNLRRGRGYVLEPPKDH